MLLKHEEVDSKVVVTDNEINEIYQQEYSPLLSLRSLTFASEEQCDLFLAAVSGGKTTEDVLSDTNLSLPSDALSETVVQRPNQLPPQIRTLYDATPDNRYLEPYEYNNSWFIIEISHKEPGYDSDLAMVSEGIRYTLNKQKQRQLTAELNLALINKLNVQVNDEVIDKITLEPPSDELAQQVTITFPGMTITAQVIYDNAKTYYDRYGGEKIKGTTFKDIVRRVTNDIVAQTVTSIEALNRHYEEKQPLKGVFFFYQRHRLIRELETELIEPRTQVSDQEISAAYEKNKNEYAYPERVKYAAVETKNEKLALKIKEQLRQGQNYSTVLAPLAPMGIETKDTPTAHLIEPMRELLSKLQPGQSDMLQVDETYHFIQLKEPARIDYRPFDEVKESISTKLKQQKFDQARADLVTKLRQRSTITINQGNWKTCIKKLKEN